jgi:hyperosmotically inducible periplasmic protein
MKAIPILLCALGLGCATTSSAKEPARGSGESWESVRESSRPAPDPSLAPPTAVQDTQAEQERATPIRAPGPVSERTRTPDSKATDATTTDPTSVASAADNTGVNKRDRHDNALTPMDQGGSPEDLRITKEIRQAVVGASSLSFTAKNVKIITVNGKVTLRGPVGSESERMDVETMARRVAGPQQVDNQLEVKR